MTEAAAPDTELARHIQVWAESLSEVLGQISGSPLACVVLSEAPSDLAAPGAGEFWIVCACTGGLRGEMSLRLPPASTLRLAQIFTSEPAAPEAETTDDHREAVVELFRQTAGLIATSVKARWGEVQFRLDAAPGAPSWPSSSTAWIRAGEDPATALLMEIHLSAALVAALRTEKTDAAKPAASAPAQVPSSQENKVKLDLLMDVELAVTLRFGSRRLLLREILDLNPGAVIELDRQVDEPVDVLLDGRLVARGEVVVMDGNYGLRVTEVASPTGI